MSLALSGMGSERAILQLLQQSSSGLRIGGVASGQPASSTSAPTVDILGASRLSMALMAFLTQLGSSGFGQGGGAQQQNDQGGNGASYPLAMPKLSPIAQDLTALLSAVQSGNVTAAQNALTTLQLDSATLAKANVAAGASSRPSQSDGGSDTSSAKTTVPTASLAAAKTNPAPQAGMQFAEAA